MPPQTHRRFEPRIDSLEDRAVPATMVALDDTNQLVYFDSSAPGDILSVVPVTGLNVGDDVFGIDFRPQTGELFALGFTTAPVAPNTLTTYVIDPHTGEATAVGSFEPFFYFGQTGPTDFDPVKDRLLYIYNIPDPGQF